MAIAAIVFVSVGVRGGFIRPTIATYVIVFALGLLYGTWIRDCESEREPGSRRNEKPFG